LDGQDSIHPSHRFEERSTSCWLTTAANRDSANRRVVIMSSNRLSNALLTFLGSRDAQAADPTNALQFN
jgi:hypothetical protein